MAQHHSTVFTVFTPTYNCAHTLHRVYRSLCEQTFRDFEWLVVDDGSTDNTGDLVRQWQEQANFPVRYHQQANQGKAVANNFAAQNADGLLFLTLDADDVCVPTALERFHFHWRSIPEVQRPTFSAVTALCMDQYGRLIGTRFPQDIMDSNSAEIRYRYHVLGEKWGFQRTDIMRNYLFPTDSSYRAIPESITWNAISRKYQTRFVNEILRVYYQRRYENSVQRSYSMASAAVHDPYGHAIWHRAVLNNDLRWFRYAPLEFVRSAMHFERFSLNSGVSTFAQYSELTNWLAKMLWLITLPLGLLLHWRDRSLVGKSSE